MKYISQLMIIFLISFVGEILSEIISLPIPGSIYGMTILFILLCCRVIKIHQVKETSDFLINIMPILFIPSGVGVISQFEQVKLIWIKLIVTIIITTFIVMSVTGLTTQAIIRLKKRRKDKI